MGTAVSVMEEKSQEEQFEIFKVYILIETIL